MKKEQINFSEISNFELSTIPFLLKEEYEKRLMKIVNDNGGSYTFKNPYLSSLEEGKNAIADISGGELLRPITKIFKNTIDGTTVVYLREGDNKDNNNSISFFGGRTFELYDFNTYEHILEMYDTENEPTPDMKKFKVLKFTNKDIIITDPCYINDTDSLDPNNYMTSSTIYGDWGCTTFDTDTKKPIGKFCADAGEVGVFDLDEVRKYNPDIDEWIKNFNWCVTKIPNFTGEVSMRVDKTECGTYDDTNKYHKKGDIIYYYSLHVFGKGSVNFETTQTSL